MQNKRARLRTSSRQITTRNGRGKGKEKNKRNKKSKNITTESFKRSKREIRTERGAPPSNSSRKRKFEPQNFTTQHPPKRTMREKTETLKEPSPKKIITTKGGKPDSKNKLKSSKTRAALPVKKAEPTKPVEAVERRESPKPEVRKPIKKFVTTNANDLSSSSEENESDSESESERGFGPNLKVKAHDGALLLMRNLPKTVDSSLILMELFPETPGVEQVCILTDENGQSTGSAEVAVSTVTQARNIIAQLRKNIYRDHEIYCTLLGTNKMQKSSNVVAPMPVELRSKKGKRKKKKSRKEQSSKTQASSTSRKTSAASKPSQTQPKPKALRILYANCVDPATRPWNWNLTQTGQKEYNEEVVEANWQEDDEVYYHVTMKKNIDDHLPDV